MYRKILFFLIICISICFFIKCFFAFVIYNQCSTVGVALKGNPLSENIIYNYIEKDFEGFLVILWRDEMDAYGSEIIRVVSKVPIIIFLIMEIILIFLYCKSAPPKT
jgi:hypothetical protein